ncbi:MAG: PleD family two-component system response regulator [Roseiflexaceae bacterium]
MLIEDSPSQALQLRLLLERSGYRVVVVGDGAAGWRAAVDHPPRLILLDVELPTLNGFQILLRLKRDRVTAAIPVVMLTSTEHISAVLRALNLGAADYLPKPDAAQQLCAVVEQLLRLGEQPEP